MGWEKQTVPFAKVQEIEERLVGKAKQADLEATGKRIDSLIIGSGNANAEVTDAQVSVPKNKSYDTLGNRINEIEADTTYLVANKMKNSNFAKGYEGWTASYATGSLSGSEYTSTGSGSNATPRIKQITEIPYVQGKKVYVKALITPNSSESTRISITSRTSGGNQHIQSFGVDNPLANTDYEIDGIFTLPTTVVGEYVQFDFQHGYINSAAALGKSVKLKYFIAIDLSSSFGIGQEPAIQEIRSFISKYPNKWFDGNGNYYDINRIKEDIHNLATKKVDSSDLRASSVTVDKTTFFGKQETGVDSSNITQLKSTTIQNQSGKLYIKSGSGQTVYRVLLNPNNYYRINIVGMDKAVVHAAVTNKVLSAADADAGLFADLDAFLDDTGKSQSFEFYNHSGMALYVSFGTGTFTSTVEAFTIDKILPKIPIEPSKEFKVKYSAVTDGTRDSLTKEKELYPTLFAVKMSNARTKLRGYSQHPVPLGWLYYVDAEPYDILYADKTPDNMRKIFTWKKELTWNKTSTPKNYSPFITKSGDIIFVYRGEQASSSSNSRQNPIVYPAGDYDNPVVVDFGTNIKPTSWLQNCGADYIYNQNCFVFTEYTRPVHSRNYTWKVTEPVTNPANWRIVQEFPIKNSADGVEHSHTINFDPYSEIVYHTTGDSDLESKILCSTDYGENWRMVLTGSQHKTRLLNFVFTEDKIYWATDSQVTTHSLFEATRDSNGILDVNSIKELYRFKEAVATYASALINEPHGLLILNRYDVATIKPLNIYFWSFETNSMHIIDSLKPLGGKSLNTGFRNEAVSWYQSPVENRIVTGFGYYQNNNQILGNVDGGNIDRVCNLGLEVVRS